MQKERESKALPTVNKHKLRYINGKLRNKKGTMNFFLIDQRRKTLKND